MVDVGILAVGRIASGLALDSSSVPVRALRTEAIRPEVSDIPSVANEAAQALFDGVDADRWRVLGANELVSRTSMLWVSSQVSSTDPARVVSGWRHVVLVAEATEPGLVPTLRVLEGRVQLSVMLVGAGEELSGAERRNRVVLADCIRRGTVLQVIGTTDPDSALPVVIEAARGATPLRLLPPDAVDVGSALRLAPAYAMPEPEVPFSRLATRRLGQGTRLGALVTAIAAHHALRAVVEGPPVEVDGGAVVDLASLRESLPDAQDAASWTKRFETALATVRFEGSAPLVDTIGFALQPVAAEVEAVLRTATTIRAHRILQLRSFGAAGIRDTALQLRRHLDGVRSASETVEPLEVLNLLGGDHPNERVAWRRAFASVPSCIVRRNQPGWRVAREMVKRRYRDFCHDFSRTVGEAVAGLLAAALDPSSALPVELLRSLYGRVVQIQDGLGSVLAELNRRVHEGLEEMLVENLALRWAAADPALLLHQLAAVAVRDPVARELEQSAMAVLVRRPLGMADAVDFDLWLEELVSSSLKLPEGVQQVPRDAEVLGAVLANRPAGEFATWVNSQASGDSILWLSEDVPPGLWAWYQGSGLPVERRPGPSRLVFWQADLPSLSVAAELDRRPFEEHHLADLLLVGPEGADSQSMAAQVEAAALTVAALVFGEFTLVGRQSGGVARVQGPGLRSDALLPCGLIHDLAVDASVREVVRARIERSLAGLASRSTAPVVLQKLVELGALGPGVRLRVQLGLDQRWERRLGALLRAMLQRLARRATVSMLDHLRAEEVRALTTLPTAVSMHELHELVGSA